jgi:hypothetical protein
MDFPQNDSVTPLFIQNVGEYGTRAHPSYVFASHTWTTGNKAIYMPFAIPWPYLVSRVFWGNGSALTSNKDFGIYTADGVRIYSTGSTAEAGASGIQYVSVATPFVLPPGRYYMAISCSGTTNKAWGIALALVQYGRLSGWYQEASALPLPATATFAALAAVTPMPLCGITRTASGF